MEPSHQQASFDDEDYQDEEALIQEDASALLAGKNYDAVVTATDWTVETLISQLKKRNIKLDPSFQRRDAWTLKRKSEFIESLFLGLPVPQVVLAESKDRKGSYIVLDGKQRLLTLRQFSATSQDPEFKQLRLSGLALRADLNGVAMVDATDNPDFEDDLRFFENQTIRTVVLRNWPSEDYLYLVFLRLNSGSLPLSPQELRQVVSPGSFTDFATDFTSKSAAVMGLFNSNQQPDFRMRDVELSIRYFGLVNYLDGYTGNLKLFLDETSQKLNTEWDSLEKNVRGQSLELENAIQVTWEVFSENAFRKWNGKDFERRFNRAVFDVMVYFFRDSSTRLKALENREAVIKGFKSLCEQSGPFRTSIETTTKSIGALSTRLQLWGKKLSEILDIEVPIPKLDKNTGRITLAS
ncbi:DUF262 domain-containing protein [Polaromonas sp. CG_9.11]|uniref:DUF262 domain-containing protein n=1 Tax=Polaromonas sp. CG_9.11 TaxID=2787730 RepID=UPI0018CB7416|nr:DUF262 domain-containing protein [Polaromonas sp. CG_9.11]MBG6075382.1 hypothetical protein [Polaromonas sp. CG_9.11]